MGVSAVPSASEPGAVPPISSSHEGSVADVLVVGCGIVGAVIAWRAARRGLRVVCLDDAPGQGATHAAAGMLAPVSEAEFGEHALVRLNLDSAARWPVLAAELEADAGLPVGLVRSGTLTVGYDAGDLQQVRRLLALHERWGLDSRAVDPQDARRHEPLLGPRLSGGFWADGDHQVDPRRVHRALLGALAARRAPVVPERAARLLVSSGASPRVLGVQDASGREHTAGLVVLAAGWETGRLAASAPGLGVRVPTRPVKGQVIRLDGTGAAAGLRPRGVVRGVVQGRPVYVVARPDGEVVVGATSEELPDDRRSTAGGVFALLRDARALLPGLDELPVVELTARARPGSPDNLPSIGPTGVPGLAVAAGHHRNGILLAAVTAAAADALLSGEALPEVLGPADPRRFSEDGPAPGVPAGVGRRGA